MPDDPRLLADAARRAAGALADVVTDPRFVPPPAGPWSVADICTHAAWCVDNAAAVARPDGPDVYDATAAHDHAQVSARTGSLHDAAAQLRAAGGRLAAAVVDLPHDRPVRLHIPSTVGPGLHADATVTQLVQHTVFDHLPYHTAGYLEDLTGPGPARPLPQLAATHARIADLAGRLRTAGDRRGDFARIYALMTAAVQEALAAGRFDRPGWLSGLLDRFGQAWFDALDSWDAGRTAPPAWRLAFHHCRTGRPDLLRDVLLGVSAHINHDLAHVVADVAPPPGPDRDVAAHDFRTVDTVIAGLLPLVRTLTSAAGTPFSATLHWQPAGYWADLLAAWRAAAWRDGIALADARRHRRTRTVRRVEAQVARRAVYWGRTIVAAGDAGTVVGRLASRRAGHPRRTVTGQVGLAGAPRLLAAAARLPVPSWTATCRCVRPRLLRCSCTAA